MTLVLPSLILPLKSADNLVPDLARYEKTWLLAYCSDRYFQISWFGYAVHHDCKAQIAIAIWWFPFPQGQLHHIVRGIGIGKERFVCMSV